VDELEALRAALRLAEQREQLAKMASASLEEMTRQHGPAMARLKGELQQARDALLAAERQHIYEVGVLQEELCHREYEASQHTESSQRQSDEEEHSRAQNQGEIQLAAQLAELRQRLEAKDQELHEAWQTIEARQGQQALQMAGPVTPSSEELKQKLSETETKLKNAQRAVLLLNSRLEEKAQRAESIERELQRQQERIAELEGRCLAMHEGNVPLPGPLTELQEQLQRREADIADLEQELQSTVRVLAELRAREEAHADRTAELEAAWEEIAQERERLRDDSNKLKAERALFLKASSAVKLLEEN